MSSELKRRAEMARPGPLHRDERVEPGHVGEQREACVVRAAGADAVEGLTGDQRELEHDP